MPTKSRRKLSASKEDYLEAILMLIRRDRVARVRDIAGHLGVGMPAVTAALKALSERDLVNYDPYQVITLTDRGRDLAEAIRHRHTILHSFLTDVLGLDADFAESSACRMEHAVSDEVLERLGDFASFVRMCPRAGEQWVRRFHEFERQAPANRKQCRACLREAATLFERGEAPDSPSTAHREPAPAGKTKR